MTVKIEQELKNRVKIARTLTRLKHSIAVDNELNEKLDAMKKAYWKQIQRGRWPSEINVEAFGEKVFEVEGPRPRTAKRTQQHPQREAK